MTEQLFKSGGKGKKVGGIWKKWRIERGEKESHLVQLLT